LFITTVVLSSARLHSIGGWGGLSFRYDLAPSPIQHAFQFKAAVS